MPPQRAASMSLAVSGTNNGFVGAPLLLLLIPESAGLAIGMSMLVDNVVIIPVALILFEAASERGAPLGRRIGGDEIHEHQDHCRRRADEQLPRLEDRHLAGPHLARHGEHRSIGLAQHRGRHAPHAGSQHGSHDHGGDDQLVPEQGRQQRHGEHGDGGGDQRGSQHEPIQSEPSGLVLSLPGDDDAAPEAYAS